ncbi:hypothetical protein V6N13_037781 [Hibiscus sabdariffa]
MAFKFLVCLAFFSMFLTYLVHGVPTTPSLPSFNISQGDLLKYLGLPNFGHILPALYVFGDSIIDAGNNNYLDTITRANYTPYGTDFGASQPTGRYTNGRTVVDFIGSVSTCWAAISPPVLGMSAAEVENTLTGVNYGSGSGGIQDLPPEPAHISGATAWVYIGSLDNNVIMQPNMLKSRNTYKSNTSCVEDINRRISYYNGLLPNMLAKLENSLKGSTFVVCDLYRVFADVYAQPAAYGFMNVSGFCCPDSAGNGTRGCAEGGVPCMDRETIFYFDPFHPTEMVHFLWVRRFLLEDSLCSPYNLLKLIIQL